MPRFIVIGLFFAAVCFPAGVWASEDSDPFMFGDEIPVEEVSVDSVPAEAAAAQPAVTWQEENAPALQSTSPAGDDFAPPPSDAALPVAGQVPAMPMLQVSPAQPAAAESEAPAPLPKISKDQALTDTLKQDSAVEKPELPLPGVEGTWVGKLATTNPLSLLGSDQPASADANLEKLVNDARGNGAKNNRRSNASVFDISGVMLRMSLKQVDETMQNRGFRKIMQKYQIPNFIKWRNEEFCRNTGVVGYERVESCVTQKAKKDNHQYVQTAKYAKYDTKEEMEVTFSSNFTDNKVFKIVYKSQAAGVTGNSPKATYLRNIKIYDFWKKINQKYGKPDDKDNVTWGMGGDKPFLKASTGYLKLEDPMLRELDYTRMSREDQRYMNTDLYSF